MVLSVLTGLKMNNNIKLKEILIYSLLSFVVIIVLYGYINSHIVINGDITDKYIKKFISIQNISPQRLYINVWRMTRKGGETGIENR